MILGEPVTLKVTNNLAWNISLKERNKAQLFLSLPASSNLAHAPAAIQASDEAVFTRLLSALHRLCRRLKGKLASRLAVSESFTYQQNLFVGCKRSLESKLYDFTSILHNKCLNSTRCKLFHTSSCSI